MSDEAVMSSLARVWSLLDNNKLEVAEMSYRAVQSQYPDHAGVKVTEMLLLHQSKEWDRALALAVKFATEETEVYAKSQDYLQMIAHVLQAQRHLKPLGVLYKQACVNFPKEDNLLENTVMCFVCLKDFKEVQMLSMQLFKKTGKVLHQTWAIMANLFATPADAPPETLQLVIATRMIEQQLGNKTATYATAGMYVEALLRQQQYDKALEFIQSENGILLGMESSRLEKCYEIFKLKKRTSDAAAVSLFLWRNLEPDNWTYFANLLTAVENAEAEKLTSEANLNLTLATRVIATDKNSDGKFVVDVPAVLTVAELVPIAEDLVQKQVGNKKKLRGPYMASLEIALKVAEKKQQGTTDLQAKLERYLADFATKATCFWDTAKFSAALRRLGSTTVWWEAALPQTADVSDKSDLATHQKMILRYQYELLHLSFQDDACLETCRQMVQQCIQGLKKSASLSKSLVWSEEGLTDGYAVVGLNATLKAYQHTGAKELSWIWLGLNLLQFTAARKKNNPILLMYSTLYHRLLGAFDAASWEQLDMKSVQYDSMALVDLHTMIDAGGCFPLVDKVRERLWYSESHYRRTSAEMTEVRGKIFAHVAPTKQTEVDMFETKQDNSIARLESHVLAIIFDLTNCGNKKEVSDILHSSKKNRNLKFDLEDSEIECHHDDKIVKSITLYAAGSTEGDAEGTAFEQLLLPRMALKDRISKVRFLATVLRVLSDVAFRAQLEEELEKNNIAEKKMGESAPALTIVQEKLQGVLAGLRLAETDKTKAAIKGWDHESQHFTNDFLAVSASVSKVFSILLDVLLAVIDTPLGEKPTVVEAAATSLAEACGSIEVDSKNLPLLNLIVVGFGFLTTGQISEAAKIVEKKLSDFQKQRNATQGSWAKWKPERKPQWVAAAVPLLDSVSGLGQMERAACLKEFGAKVDAQQASLAKELKRMTLEAKAIAK